MSASSMTPSVPWAAARGLLPAARRRSRQRRFRGHVRRPVHGQHRPSRRRVQHLAGGIPPEFADLFGGGFGGRQPGFQRDPAEGRGPHGDHHAFPSPGPSAAPPSACANPDGEVIDVRVPAGIKDGQKVRVRGKGQPGPAGNGDLVVSVYVKPPRFLHARRRQPPHPRPGHLPGGCSGRRHRGAHHRRRKGPGPRSGRHAVRAARCGSRAAA